MMTEHLPAGALANVPRLAAAIGRRAVDTAAALNMQIVDRTLPKSSLEEIRSKVVSIATNEITPVLSPWLTNRRTWLAAVKSVGDALGVCYLGDYALEQSAAFDLDAARAIVCRIAHDAGVEDAMAAGFVEDLADFYLREAGDSPHGDSVDDLVSWYSVKSKDVLFAQVLGMSSAGFQISSDDMKTLSHAGTALEVMDDLRDIAEDRERRSSNPFAAMASAVRQSSLYRVVELACLEGICGSVESGGVSPCVRSYGFAVRRRILTGVVSV